MLPKPAPRPGAPGPQLTEEEVLSILGRFQCPGSPNVWAKYLGQKGPLAYDEKNDWRKLTRLQAGEAGTWCVDDDTGEVKTDKEAAPSTVNIRRRPECW
jgi:hypothetical protein